MPNRSNTIFKLSQGSCYFSQKSVNIAGLFFGMHVTERKFHPLEICSNRDLMIRQQRIHENLAEK